MFHAEAFTFDEAFTHSEGSVVIAMITHESPQAVSRSRVLGSLRPIGIARCAPAQPHAQDVERDGVCVRVRASDDVERCGEGQGGAEGHNDGLELGREVQPGVYEVAVGLAGVALGAGGVVRVFEG